VPGGGQEGAGGGAGGPEGAGEGRRGQEWGRRGAGGGQEGGTRGGGGWLLDLKVGINIYLLWFMDVSLIPMHLSTKT
jgi:hypothetical protein